MGARIWCPTFVPGWGGGNCVLHGHTSDSVLFEGSFSGESGEEAFGEDDGVVHVRLDEPANGAFHSLHD